MDRWRVACAVLLIAIQGCSRSPGKPASTEISGPAVVAETSASGEIVTRKPTQQEQASSRDSEAALAAVDTKYPRPEAPAEDAPLYRVRSVESNGLIVLEDGRTLELGGVDCTEEGLAYISRLLLDENSRIVLPSAATQGSSEIWMADVSSRRPGRSAAYSLIVETAITSGWCRPNERASERYRALAALPK